MVSYAADPCDGLAFVGRWRTDGSTLGWVDSTCICSRWAIEQARALRIEQEATAAPLMRLRGATCR
jgi:hypothetical protein